MAGAEPPRGPETELSEGRQGAAEAFGGGFWPGFLDEVAKDFFFSRGSTVGPKAPGQVFAQSGLFWGPSRGDVKRKDTWLRRQLTARGTRPPTPDGIVRGRDADCKPKAGNWVIHSLL